MKISQYATELLSDGLVSSAASTFAPSLIELNNGAPHDLADFLLNGDNEDPRKLLFKNPTDKAKFTNRLRNFSTYQDSREAMFFFMYNLGMLYAPLGQYTLAMHDNGLPLDYGEKPIRRRDLLGRALSCFTAASAASSGALLLKSFGLEIEAFDSARLYNGLTAEIDLPLQSQEILKKRLQLAAEKLQTMYKHFAAAGGSYLGSWFSQKGRIRMLKRLHSLEKSSASD
ncbi:MAG: hypothetical protein OXU45_05275 [Candidatus Melainabacteria bacterium]|nr:hypothetical protein [Candidatus Melainabacteria bacterium]